MVRLVLQYTTINPTCNTITNPNTNTTLLLPMPNTNTTLLLPMPNTNTTTLLF